MPPGPRALLRDLPNLSWRGIEAPIFEIERDTSHTIVDHEQPDVDGATLESTGRKPRSISCTLMFRNGIVLGSYNGGARLFPDTFDRFMRALDDRSTGELIHPYHGTIFAKVVSFKDSFTGDKTDGADVSVSWREDNRQGPGVVTLNAQFIAVAQVSAVALDVALGNVVADPRLKLIIAPYVPSTSFSDLTRSIVGGLNAITNASVNAQNQIPALLGQLTQIERALDIASQPLQASPAQILLGPLYPLATSPAAIATARAALAKLRAAMFAAQKGGAGGVLTYVTATVATLGSLASLLGTSTTDILATNPGLVRAPVIPLGTTIRYHRATPRPVTGARPT